MELIYALVVIFATSSGLVCVYALISSYLLYTSMTKLSRGEDFARLVNALFLTVFVGFIYTLWNVLIQLRLINLSNEVIVSLISNLLISIFFVMLAYLAFLTKQLSTKFGFRKVGQEISQYLNHSSKSRKKGVQKKRR